MHASSLSISVPVDATAGRASLQLTSPVPLKNLGLQFDSGASGGRGRSSTISGAMSVSPRSDAGSTASLSEEDVIFDYGVFVITWQDKIKMKHYGECEQYCRNMIQVLYRAEQSISNNDSLDSDTKSTLSKECLEYRSKVHFSLGYLYKKYFRGKMDEAKRQYELSVSCDSQNPAAHFNLANLLVDEFGDTGLHSREHFEAAIVIEPSYTLYRMVYAEWLWKDCDRPSDARKQYEAMLVYEEANHVNDGHFNYALLLRDHFKEYDKAVEHFEIALRIDPTDTEAETELMQTKKQRDQQLTAALSKKSAMTSGLPHGSSAAGSTGLSSSSSRAKGGSSGSSSDGGSSSSSSRSSDGGTTTTSDDEIQVMDGGVVTLEQMKKHGRGGSFRGSIKELGFVEDSPDSQTIEQVLQVNAELTGEMQRVQQENESLKIVLQQTQVVLGQFTDSHRKAMKQYINGGPSMVEKNAAKVHRLLKQLESIHSSIPEIETVWTFQATSPSLSDASIP